MGTPQGQKISMLGTSGDAAMTTTACASLCTHLRISFNAALEMLSIVFCKLLTIYRMLV
jgi:hypothetical protein